VPWERVRRHGPLRESGQQGPQRRTRPRACAMSDGEQVKGMHAVKKSSRAAPSSPFQPRTTKSLSKQTAPERRAQGAVAMIGPA
jgi:hypothetical protein